MSYETTYHLMLNEDATPQHRERGHRPSAP